MILHLWHFQQRNFAEMEIEKRETECKIILFSILRFTTNAIVKVTEQQKGNRVSSNRTCREPSLLR